jgi:hypothetical protein
MWTYDRQPPFEACQQIISPTTGIAALDKLKKGTRTRTGWMFIHYSLFIIHFRVSQFFSFHLNQFGRWNLNLGAMRLPSRETEMQQMYESRGKDYATGMVNSILFLLLLSFLFFLILRQH